jgi:hypothetical protein
VTVLFVTGIVCLLFVIALSVIGISISDPSAQRRIGHVTFRLAAVGVTCLAWFLVLVVTA